MWVKVYQLHIRYGTVKIPLDHPRYDSLMTRERLVEMVEEGLVTPTGLISHGRGEAYDYLMGERSLDSTILSEKVAIAYLLNATNPVICINGNAAALNPEGLISLAERVNARIEVNIFHRSEERMEGLISFLESKGARNVLGRNPDARIPGLSSDRALCTMEGIYKSDAILVPIEDGDRAEALVRMGKIVIAIDLNPISRTSKMATVSISDEMSRALRNMMSFADELNGDAKERERLIEGYSNVENIGKTLDCICNNLKNEMGR